MAEKIIMPKLGLTMEEGVINKWLVKEGDQVEKGDALFEVATDKVNMEVESTANGVVLKIMAAEGKPFQLPKRSLMLGNQVKLLKKKKNLFQLLRKLKRNRYQSK